MNRRKFVRNLTLLSAGLSAPTFLVNSVRAAKSAGLANLATDPGKILLVVELAGGNDGLNTVVPYSNDFYLQSRNKSGGSNLAITSQDVLQLNGEYGLHPRMGGFKDLWDSGYLSILHGVGYPNPNRSHFRSRDIWHTAEPIEIGTDGWLAKYFDSLGESGSLQGFNVGGGVPKAMISSQGSSPAIQSIDTFQLETDPFHPGDASNKNAAFQQVLGQPQSKFNLQEFVGRTALDATLTSIELLEGQSNYNSTVVYPQGAFGQNLRTIAQIIAADVGARVYYVTIGGFDTHAEQAESNNSLIGVHADLLETVSAGLKAFWDDMKEMGLEEEVLIMTFSEFGRRLFANASDGTDHGTANQMFLIGGAVKPGFYGTHPSLAPEDLDPVGDMIHTLDFRSVYATMLGTWLGTDPVPILGGSFPTVDAIETAG